MFLVRVVAVQHGRWSLEVLHQRHGLLAVLVADGLADRRERSRVAAGQLGAHDPLVQQAQHHHLGVEVGHPLPQDRIVATQFPDAGQHRRVVRAAAPQHAALGQRHPFVGQGDLGQAPALVLGAHQVLDGNLHVGQEGLVEVVAAGHLHDGTDLDARGGHVQQQVGDALLGWPFVRRADQQDAPVGDVGPGGPDLGTVDDVPVAVADGPGSQRGQVRTGLRLAEQLAPVLGVVQHRREEAVLLGLGAAGDDRRAGPSHADGGAGDANPGPPELVVDDELGDGVRVAAPRRGPVGGDEPAAGQGGPIGVGVDLQPGADLEAPRVVVGGKGEVHGRLESGRWRRPGRPRPGR